jgi:multiple sugar transport system permease protein
MSFQNYNLMNPSKNGFVGLKNYITAFHDPLFYQSLFNTLIWVVFGVGLQFVFGFILALLLNRSFKGRGVIRAVALPLGLVDVKVCAVDETWSGLKLVIRKELR